MAGRVAAVRVQMTKFTGRQDGVVGVVVVGVALTVAVMTVICDARSLVMMRLLAQRSAEQG